jgi:hypothetical protein
MSIRVMLVYPNQRGMNMLPPAIGLLSAILKDRGHIVELFDTTYYESTDDSKVVRGDSDSLKTDKLMARPYNMPIEITLKRTNVFDDFKQEVEAFGPDLLAMSCTEDMFLLGIRLLGKVREHKIPTILGGVFATFAPDLALSYPEIDIICKGEGEVALPELCRRLERGLPYDDISNLWVKGRDGAITKNPIEIVDVKFGIQANMLGIIVFYIVSPVHVRNVQLLAPQLGSWKLRIVYEEPVYGLKVDEMRDLPYETIAVRKGAIPDNLWQGDIKAMVFSSVQARSVPVELVAGGLRRGIPMIAIEESNQLALNQGRINNYILPVDRVLAASTYERKAMVEAGFPAHRFTVSGWPFYSGHIGKISSEEKRDRKKALGLDPLRPVAALTLSWVHDADEGPVVRRRLLTLAARLPAEYQLVVKPHPIEVVDILMPFIREYAPNAQVIDGMIPSPELLKATDVLLNRGASQVCLEALLQQIPVVILNTGAKTLFHGLTERLIVGDAAELQRALKLVTGEENAFAAYDDFFKEHLHVMPDEARDRVVEGIISMIKEGVDGDYRGEQWFDMALFQAWLGEYEDAHESVVRPEVRDVNCPTQEFIRLLECRAVREDLEELRRYFSEGFRTHFLRCLWIRQMLARKDAPAVDDVQWMRSFPPVTHPVWFVKDARGWAFHLANTGNYDVAAEFADSVYRRHQQVPEIAELANDINEYLGGRIGRAKVLLKHGLINLLRPIARKLENSGLLNALGIRK